jgi:hypothetical protein
MPLTVPVKVGDAKLAFKDKLFVNVEDVIKDGKVVLILFIEFN